MSNLWAETAQLATERSLPQAIDRLVELTVATRHSADAVKWRAERAEYPELAPPPGRSSDRRRTTLGTAKDQASGCSRRTIGPGIGEEAAHLVAGGPGGELVEHVAEVRPWVESMPRRAGAHTQ